MVVFWLHVIFEIIEHDCQGRIILSDDIRQGDSSKVGLYREEIINFFFPILSLSVNKLSGRLNLELLP